MAIDRYSYPFTAIVGQDEMKLALVLNAINPSIGGVLIRGEKGTGKSTAVRALARLLPEQDVVAGCHFGCLPVKSGGTPPAGRPGQAGPVGPAPPSDRDNLCLDCRARLNDGEEL